MTPIARRDGATIIGTFVDSLSWAETLERISAWAARAESRYVCVSNVHSLVSARRDPAFAHVLADADMVTPDGMPLVWSLRRRGYTAQQRIYGPDLMWNYCEVAAREGQSIFLYGSTRQTLAKLTERLEGAFPGLKISGAYAPPFRTLEPEEEARVVSAINDTDARIVFVALGCPKQELWMASQRGKVRAVMIGVGAAFDFHAGNVRQAPPALQSIGMEWLFRFAMEPRRLWRRYLVTNGLYLIYLARGLWPNGNR
jgi:N-acetylglucosaminyldiphosphoundecaprenol N-acetyl-beta-D-mannosaminyltransferase